MYLQLLSSKFIVIGTLSLGSYVARTGDMAFQSWFTLAFQGLNSLRQIFMLISWIEG